MIGKRIGPYEISAQLGSGAMGEVYRAIDTSLGREVAIKLLPPTFADDAERLARFEREAKILASLNHPNIATVYGLSEEDGLRALVMELVEGRSLARRMEDGDLPLEESLSIALQIAEAVEEAHEQGIVHRDLKPSNVLLDQEGLVKVVDFGLAKSLESVQPPLPKPSAGAAVPEPGFDGTRVGKVLGTAGYMSPEQAKGLPVDKRTDVWSFGVVLYEMLSGRRLAGGEPLPDDIEWIYHRGIDLEALPREPLVEIHRLLGRCIERDPRRRLRDIGEARIVIEGVLERLREPDPGLEVALLAAKQPAGLLALAAAVLGGVAVGWLLHWMTSRGSGESGDR